MPPERVDLDKDKRRFEGTEWVVDDDGQAQTEEEDSGVNYATASHGDVHAQDAADGNREEEQHGSDHRNPWRTTKRILLATVDDDSTVVYYIIHDGIVKPRQN